ncbi:MAG: hypothetical protein K0R05_4608 [Anaerocolumna sp.]|nr:hypothetical protein [Anaerocolumna sp.]
MGKIDFDRIYKEYFKQVYAYVLGLCANQALAEELTQVKVLL